MFKYLEQGIYGTYNQQILSNLAKGNESFLQRMSLLQTLDIHRGCVNSVVWDDTGEYLLSGSDDQQLIISKPWDGKTFKKLSTSHRANIFSAKFIPYSSNNQIISCSGDGILIYTDLNQYDETYDCRFTCHVGTCYDVITIPSDPYSFLSCGEDGTVRWFDLRIKTSCLAHECKDDILLNMGRAVTAIAVNPLAHFQMAVSTQDSTIHIYDRRMLGTKAHDSYLSESNKAVMMRLKPQSLEGKKHRVTSLRYNSTGDQVLASYSSDYLYLFDTKNFKEVPLETSSGANLNPDADSEPTLKRLRLRGDWSDTGPQAVPQGEMANQPEEVGQARPALQSTLMQRMTDILSRMLHSPAQRGGRRPAEGIRNAEGGEGGGNSGEGGGGGGLIGGNAGEGGSGERGGEGNSLHLSSMGNLPSGDDGIPAGSQEEPGRETSSAPPSIASPADGFLPYPRLSDPALLFSYHPAFVGPHQEPMSGTGSPLGVPGSPVRVPGSPKEVPGSSEAERMEPGSPVRERMEPGSPEGQRMSVEGPVFPVGESGSPEGARGSEEELEAMEGATPSTSNALAGEVKEDRQSTRDNTPVPETFLLENASKDWDETGTKSSSETCTKTSEPGTETSSTEPGTTTSTETGTETSTETCTKTATEAVAEESGAPGPSVRKRTSSDTSKELPVEGAAEDSVLVPAEFVQNPAESLQFLAESVLVSAESVQFPSESAETSGYPGVSEARNVLDDPDTRMDDSDDPETSSGSRRRGRERGVGEQAPETDDFSSSSSSSLSYRRRNCRMAKLVDRVMERKKAERMGIERGVPYGKEVQQYRGHRNARTMIKEACFWGENHVMSGSDCGRVFVWDKKTGELVMLWEADRHVVNCLQPHPSLPVLATSGIDYDVKLWAPIRADHSFDEHKASEITKRNEMLLAETRDTVTVPATFMIRMLATLNQLRHDRMRNRNQNPDEEEEEEEVEE